MKTNIKNYFLVLVLLLAGSAGVEAQMTIGSQAEPHKGALLDLKQPDASTKMGLKLPVVSLDDATLYGLTSGDQATAAGMVVYNTNPDIANGHGVGIYVWDGTNWMKAGTTAGTPGVSVASVSLNKATTSIAVGSTETLTATVAPTNATNQSVTWSSSNESVATVSGGIVNALAPGTTTITVTTVDGEKTASCEVMVTGTTTPEPATVEFAGLWWMDRNLGVDPNIDPNPSEYSAIGHATGGELHGDTYQWGRQADGHEKLDSGGYYGDLISDEELDENGQIPPNHPAYGLLVCPSGPYGSWRNTGSRYLWSENSPANPCPTGFRIPTVDEWTTFLATITDDELFTLTPEHQAISVAEGNLTFPITSLRQAPSEVGWEGPTCYYWSSTDDDNDEFAYAANFDAGFSQTRNDWDQLPGGYKNARRVMLRAVALPVRCVKK